MVKMNVLTLPYLPIVYTRLLVNRYGAVGYTDNRSKKFEYTIRRKVLKYAQY